MFNLFGPDKSTQEIIDDTLGTNPFGWQYVPKESVEHLKGEAEKFYKEIQSLKALQKGYIHERDAAREINAKLLKEKEELKAQLKSIEEDGTEEHNAAIKLRQENAHLKDIIDKYRNAFKLESFKDTWKTQYDQEVAKNTKLEDKVKELENEIKNWRTGVMHWKDLYDEKADYVDELVKEVNGLRHLKKENVELMERVSEIDSDQNEAYRAEIFTLKNDIAVLKAKYQILDHNYQGCTKYRDEYKHQLNAANKENEKLKEHTKNLREQQTFLYQENEKLKKDIIDYVYEKDEQKHPMYPIHWGGYEPEKWSTTKVAVDDAVQAKLREVYGIEEKKTFKPWVEEPIDWKGSSKSIPNKFQEQEKWICPCNVCKIERGEK